MKVAKSDVDSFPSPEYFKYILSRQIYFRGINNERSRNVDVISVNTTCESTLLVSETIVRYQAFNRSKESIETISKFI